MSQPEETQDDGWDHGWEEHRTRQLRRMAELPFSKKLEWLEEAQKFGEFLIDQANRSKKDKG